MFYSARGPQTSIRGGFIMKKWCMALLLIVAASASAQVRVGTSSVVITPGKGTPLAGYYSARFADGVHDDLYAKTVVIEQGGVKVALVCCDLISMSRTVAEEARAIISKTTH